MRIVPINSTHYSRKISHTSFESNNLLSVLSNFTQCCEERLQPCPRNLGIAIYSHFRSLCHENLNFLKGVKPVCKKDNHLEVVYFKVDYFPEDKDAWVVRLD